MPERGLGCPPIVMPGLGPGIHELDPSACGRLGNTRRIWRPAAGKLVDGRAKPGHDAEEERAVLVERMRVSPQNGSFMPGGRDMPPVTLAISSATWASTLVL